MRSGMICLGSSSPYGPTFSLIYQHRFGTWWFGEKCLWSTCAGVQEGLAAALCGLWRCLGAEEALGIVRLLCSDTLCVKLCRLGPASPRWTF